MKLEANILQVKLCLAAAIETDRKFYLNLFLFLFLKISFIHPIEKKKQMAYEKLMIKQTAAKIILYIQFCKVQLLFLFENVAC